MKSALLVLLALALACVVFIVARTESQPASIVVNATDAETVAAEHSSEVLARPIDGSARSAVSDSSARPAAIAKPSDSIDKDPMENGSVFGRAFIRGARGSIAAAGKLSLHLEAHHPDRWMSLDQTVRPDGSLDLGPNGEFEVKHLPLGTWSIGCHVPDCAPAEQRIVLTPDKPRVEIDFELNRKRVLRIALHDVDGHPLIANLSKAGSKVGSFLGAFLCTVQPTIGEPPLAGGGALVFRTHVVGRGDADPWSEVELDRQELLWVSVAVGDRTLGFHDVQPGEEDVVVVVPSERVLGALGTAEVTVVDAWSSAPLEKADVSVRQSRGSTDAQGRVRFEGLLPGDVRISAVVKDHVVGSSTVSISPAAVARSELRLEPSVSISGILQNELGARASGYVQVIPLTGDRSVIRGARAGADGTFAIAGLAHGEYALADSDESSNVSPSAALLLDKQSLRDGMVYVDARAGPVSNVVVPAGHFDSKKTTAHRSAK